MKIKMKNSIVKKLFLVNSVVFVSLIVVSLFFQQVLFEKFYIHKRKNESFNVSKNFVSIYSTNGDLKEAFEKSVEGEKAFGYRFLILDKYGDVKYVINPAIDRAAKENIKILGEILFRIKTDNLLSQVQDNTYKTVVYYEKRIPLSSIITIYNYKEKDEFIVCATSMQPINEATKVIKEFYLYFFIAGVIITVILSLVYSKNVSKPILEIKDTADRIANLDFSKNVDVKTDDELGMLAKAINTMSYNLQNTLNSLKEANKKLEEDIEKERKLEKMRKDFIATTSHELKTPISLIQGYLEAFKDDIFPMEDKDYYIDILLDETKKMGNLVNDMLDLSQLESGKYTLQIEKFDLSLLVKKVVNKFKANINEKNINLDLNVSEAIVDGDFNRIEQVISNFLTNAIRHTDGKIKINLLKELDYVKLDVINSGNRIPEEEIENIWSKFYKIDKSGNKKYGGTGLGLSIVKNIIDLHDGEVGVNNLEDGVCFYFKLPLSNVVDKRVEL